MSVGANQESKHRKPATGPVISMLAFSSAQHRGREQQRRHPRHGGPLGNLALQLLHCAVLSPAAGQPQLRRHGDPAPRHHLAQVVHHSMGRFQKDLRIFHFNFHSFPVALSAERTGNRCGCVKAGRDRRTAGSSRSSPGTPSPSPTSTGGKTWWTPILLRCCRFQSGVYLCIATNSVPPSVSKRVQLYVDFPPTLWITHQLVLSTALLLRAELCRAGGGSAGRLRQYRVSHRRPPPLPQLLARPAGQLHQPAVSPVLSQLVKSGLKTYILTLNCLVVETCLFKLTLYCLSSLLLQCTSLLDLNKNFTKRFTKSNICRETISEFE